MEKIATPQVVGISLYVVGGRSLDGLLLLPEQLHLQLLDNGVGNFVLDGKDIRQIPIETFSPDMAAVFRVDKLARDADSGSSFSYTSLKNVTHSQLLADLLHLDRFIFVSERGVSRDDEESGNLRKIGNDILGNAVAEIFLLRVAAHIVERQNGDGRPIIGFRIHPDNNWLFQQNTVNANGFFDVL